MIILNGMWLYLMRFLKINGKDTPDLSIMYCMISILKITRIQKIVSITYVVHQL